MANKPLKNLTIYFLIVILWAILFIPNNIKTRPFYSLEGRRALLAKSILEDGDWLSPKLCGQHYVAKPPLFTWLIAISAFFSRGVNEVSVRLPALLATLATGLLVFFFARMHLAKLSAFLATLTFFTLPLVLQTGSSGEVDLFVMLISFIVFIYWWNKYSTGVLKWGDWVGLGLLISLGSLTKGFSIQIFFFPAALYLLLGRRLWKQLFGFLACLTISLLPLAIWAFLVYQRGDGEVWAREMSRLSEYKGISTYISTHIYYLKIIIKAYFPWIIVGGLFLLLKLFKRKKGNSQTQELFNFLFIYISVGSLIVFLLPSLAPRYLIPIAPVLGILSGFAYQEWGENKKTVKYFWFVLIVAVSLRFIYIFLGIPWVSKNIWSKEFYDIRYNARVISDIVKKETIFKLSPELYNVVFYIDADVRAIKPDDFFKIKEGGFILADYDLAKAIIQNPSFQGRIVHGPFRYGETDVVLVKVEKI